MSKTCYKEGFISKCTKRLLSDRIKRLIFLSSITAHLDKTHTPDKALAERLNNLMNIGYRSNSLVLPMNLSERVWKQLDLNKELKDKGILEEYNLGNDKDVEALTPKIIRIMSNIIIENTPSYLNYGSKKTMRNDLFYLLKNYGSLRFV